MSNSIAIQTLVVSFVCFLFVEPSAADDREKVLASQNRWEELRATHDGDYQYTVKWEGFSPSGHETTILVRNNKVIGREYRTFASWKPQESDVVQKEWAEAATELGTHKEGARPRTLGAVYREAIEIASRKLEDYEKRFVTFDQQGLLLKCCIDDERIADDGCRGVELASIRFAPQKSLSEDSDLKLTAKNNGQTFQVPLGTKITVQLESNRTTGFSWNNATQSESLEAVGEIQYSTSESQLGSGGQATATFRASKPGTGVLKLEYKRTFEEKAAAKTFQVTIQVQEKGAGDNQQSTHRSPNGKVFPSHWGTPPKIQTRDLRPLPGDYGQGSSTLANWIQTNLDNELRLTIKDDQKTFQVPVGGVISIQLASNRTTGFRWIDATKSDKIQLIGEIQYAAQGSLAGSGGEATANFRASKPGESVLILEYLRTFEDKPASKTFQVKIEVQEMADSEKAETTYRSPNGKIFPVHWGAPPKMQTRDLRPLPGGYGQGSGTLAKWIQANLDRDAKNKQQDK